MKPEIVFVHGAFSDGSHWAKVIRLLSAAGLRASAVQLNLQGFHADADLVRRHLATRGDTDVILVGHSYGGTLISEVSADEPRVKGLIYVAAAAPEAGVAFATFMAEHPCSYQSNPEIDDAGCLWLPVADCLHGLAHDLPEWEGLVLWAVQKPLLAASFGDCATREGWQQKPCWYLIAENDRMFSVSAQVKLAEQMNATTYRVPSGHMVALSHPEAVAKVVDDAVKKLEKTTLQPL